jgi:eukaryotic-like serine/threonine-protein kinase
MGLIPSSWNKKKLLLWFLGSFSILILLLVVLDKYIMPAIVNSSKTIEVPSVVGLKRQQAIDKLEALGLKVEEVREQFNEAIDQNTVFMQMPYAGSSVKAGRRVYLTVSKGYEVVIMPDLTMMTQRDAQVALMRSGLVFGSVTYDWKDSMPEDHIFKQSFAPGLSVKTGTTINVVLSKDSTNTVIVPAMERITLEEAMNTVTQVGLSVGEVINEPNETFAPGTVIRHSPSGGIRVKLGSSVKFYVTSQE